MQAGAHRDDLLLPVERNSHVLEVGRDSFDVVVGFESVHVHLETVL